MSPRDEDTGTDDEGVPLWHIIGYAGAALFLLGMSLFAYLLVRGYADFELPARASDSRPQHVPLDHRPVEPLRVSDAARLFAGTV